MLRGPSLDSEICRRFWPSQGRSASPVERPGWLKQPVGELAVAQKGRRAIILPAQMRV